MLSTIASLLSAAMLATRSSCDAVSELGAAAAAERKILCDAAIDSSYSEATRRCALFETAVADDSLSLRRFADGACRDRRLARDCDAEDTNVAVDLGAADTLWLAMLFDINSVVGSTVGARLTRSVRLAFARSFSDLLLFDDDIDCCKVID